MNNRRLDDFTGTIEQYVAYLEAQVLKFRAILVGQGHNLSSPPLSTFSQEWKVIPQQIVPIASTKPPSIPQATAMAQCWSDAVSSLGLFLYQDVKLQMGAPRAYLLTSDSNLPQIDPTATVYPIRGSYTYYACHGINNLVPAGQQCTRSPVPQALGMCWKTSFGDYKCFLQGNVAADVATVAAPITY